MSEDRIFVKNNLTDFEKLLFAKETLRELKESNSKLSQNNGILKSEVDELKYLLHRLIHEVDQPTLSRYRQSVIYKKKCKQVKGLEDSLKKKNLRISKLEEELIQTHIKLQNSKQRQ